MVDGFKRTADYKKGPMRSISMLPLQPSPSNLLKLITAFKCMSTKVSLIHSPMLKTYSKNRPLRVAFSLEPLDLLPVRTRIKVIQHETLEADFMGRHKMTLCKELKTVKAYPLVMVQQAASERTPARSNENYKTLKYTSKTTSNQVAVKPAI